MISRCAIAGLIAGGGLCAAGPATAAPEDVSTTETGAATYFFTGDQKTLYFHARETIEDDFICVEACLEDWVPLEATPAHAADGLWTVIRRPEGTLQWAYNGRPIYTHVRDTFPGARLGDGAGRGAWDVLKEFKRVPPNMKIDATLLGYVLANHAGKTLYFRDDAASSAAQTDAPIDQAVWQPFDAPWLALDQGDLTVHVSDGGQRQWMYQERALYTFNKDIDPGDVLGHGRDGVWSAVILEKAQALPDWMTLQWTDLGLAYADAEGLTLYAPIDIDVIEAAQSCPEECMKENWVPVLAQDDEESTGLWAIRDNDYGERQWTYKGRLLYTHTRDERPGEMKGNGIAVGYRIGDGWRIIPVESGLRRDR